MNQENELPVNQAADGRPASAGESGTPVYEAPTFRRLAVGETAAGSNFFVPDGAFTS